MARRLPSNECVQKESRAIGQERVMKNSLKFAVVVLMGSMLSAVPLRADNPTGVSTTARPGTLNYVEGQAYLGQQSLDNKSIGKVEVSPGETLATDDGKAEILLTFGVFVRLGDRSSANMISAGLTNTQMALDQGEAIVEVVQIHPENFLAVVEDGRQTQILKTGLYDFNENLHVVRVLDGEAVVKDADARNGVKVKAGHLVDLTSTEPLKTHKFNKKEVEAEDLYHWTSLRSSYLAEANAEYAPTYAYGGPGWYGDGWYWNPWFSAYTFLPWDGIFYSPFGWGFYSPWCAYGAPLFYGGGFYGGYPYHYPHRFGPDPARWGPGPHYGNPANYGHGVHYASRSEGGVAIGSLGAFGGGGVHGGAFHSGAPHGASGFHGSSSGSFHGGGGFHGGGFGGGGFHGGGFGGGGFHGGGGGFGGGGHR
jgi:hypothetical protein